MISPQSIVMIVFGVVACFAGYNMFRSMLPVWGFMLGGWIGLTLLGMFVSGPQANTVLYQVMAFVVIGLVGAIVAEPLYFVIVFLSGAILGGLMGVIFGAIIELGGLGSMGSWLALSNMSFPPIPQTPIQFLAMAVLGLVMGALAINFQKFMITASSAFVGAAALITGLGGPITNVSSSDLNRAAIMLLGWLMLGMLGMFIQFRMLGET